MRRLSLRPLSQHGSSARSSVIPDYQSATFSHGSSAPILRPRTAAPQLPPNKLVKRSSSTQNKDTNGLSRSKSKGHLPTLRRPATSHQRSATLQQFNFNLQDLDTGSIHQSKLSFDQLSAHRLSNPVLLDQFQLAQENSNWLSYFHSKISDVIVSGRPVEPESYGMRRAAGIKRIDVDQNNPQIVHLIAPTMLSDSKPAFHALSYGDIVEEETEAPQFARDEVVRKPSVNLIADQENIAPTRVKRSLSSSFASAAGNWVSKTSGSLRRPKRGTKHAASGEHRHVSAPITASQAPVDHYNAPDKSANPPIPSVTSGPPRLDSAVNALQPSHKRHLSSPLPPLSRLSSFHADFSQSGSAGGAVTHSIRPNQPSGSSTSSAAMSQLRSSQNERISVMEGSESEGRGFISGEDDDTDFKSDTLYDSLRTIASSRARAVETPLESVYDESPPSTAGNGKARRLSIHEMLGKSWNDDIKIDEEDENSQTPVRGLRHVETATTHLDVTHELLRLNLQSSPQNASVLEKDLMRPSLDDSDDDWARDDNDDDFDAHFNALSPPSKGSSVNSRGINPNVRLALANIAGNTVMDSAATDNASERPLSSLFDWSEQTVQDKQEAEKRSGRPQTAYSKQAVHSRGGRSAVRKTPHPTHVRSQSVPVVHDGVDENAPPSAKYGTWGMGTKTVSEDWDEDFEFGSGEVQDEGPHKENMFAVPESIRASQLSVRAHSGQIREFSLLVNDLKRLCRHGRDLDILDGPHRGLWEEAEGVIALASPDDDDSEDGWNNEVDSSKQKHKQTVDDDFDATSLEKLDINSPVLPPIMSKTAVVRERHSPRRRSVFSPDDDIFGGSASGTEDTTSTYLPRDARPRTPDNRSDVNGVIRTVMEAMQQRHIAGAVAEGVPNRKVQFDTNSLKALVKRSGELRDALSDIIRRVDNLTESPLRPIRQERALDSSPAFTRVFDDPGSSPPRHVVRSRGNNSVVGDASPETSPQRQMGRRFPLMSVS